MDYIIYINQIISTEGFAYYGKKFNYQYDFIRILSALAVLIIHVTGMHIENSSYSFILNQLSRFSVPMFILLAGLVTPSFNKNFESISFYKKKILSTFIPYIFALCFYLLFEIFTTSSTFEIIFFIKRIIYVIIFGYSHLYFLTVILQLYLLYPLIRYLIIKHDKFILSVSFLISLYFQSALFLMELKGIRLLPFLGRFPYYISFLPYIFYFVLGVYKNKNSIILKKNSLAINIVWLLSFIILLLESFATNTAALSIKPSIILYTITTFLFLSNLYEQLNLGRYRGKLRYLSGLTFAFYIIHVLVLRFTWKYLFNHEFGNSVGGITIEIIINIILTSIIVMLYNLIKQQIIKLLKLKNKASA